MKPRVVHTDRVPPGRARISQAKVFGDIVYVSGIVARDPKTGKTTTGGVAKQTQQILENMSVILETAGSSMALVLKMNCYLSDFDRFDEFNRVWESFFPVDPPARICTQAGRLGPGFEVEIDAIAAMPSRRAPRRKR
jgi:2-iminobutanoate/2-iminopropanoate deaminase